MFWERKHPLTFIGPARKQIRAEVCLYYGLLFIPNREYRKKPQDTSHKFPAQAEKPAIALGCLVYNTKKR